MNYKQCKSVLIRVFFIMLDVLNHIVSPPKNTGHRQISDIKQCEI